MKRLNHIIMISLALLLMCGCSKKKNFIIQGEIEGAGSQLISATYFAAGGIKRVSASTVDGRFRFSGESAHPTLVSLTLSDGTQLGPLIAENGDKITLKGNIAKPFEITVSGNGDSEKIAGWLNDNAEILSQRNVEAINSSLAQWVGKNKSSKAATALMVTYFHTPGHEHMADSLMTMLSSDARSQEIVQNFTGVLSAHLGPSETATISSMNLYDASDSVISLSLHRRKATLLCFMSDNKMARDSVVPQIRRLTTSHPASLFQAVEISSAPDSASWRRSLAGDTATWHRTWAPATVASSAIRKLAIPRYPYFIVADSAGVQLYRGSSITNAAQAIDRKLKH